MRHTVFVLVLLALTACEKDASETAGENITVRDVEYFLSNPAERKGTFKKCKKNPGELENTPECQNAREANKRAYLDEINGALSK